MHTNGEAPAAAALQDWLRGAAMALWTGPGLHPQDGLPWEALDLTGAPCAGMDRRLRVFARQAYCFAYLGRPDLGRRLFDQCLTKGFAAETGDLVAQFGPDLTPGPGVHDLYDLAFLALAASALQEAGQDMGPALDRLAQEIGRLKAPRGWYETSGQRLPRRQNPHMHLFEAATAVWRVTGRAEWREMAEACLALFRDVFLRADGAVLEFFDADWAPLRGADQAVEPGHMAEWVQLIAQYEAATGASAEVDVAALWGAVLHRLDSHGLLPDRSEPTPSDTRRLWPQTELLKAAVMRTRAGDTRLAPEAVFAPLWAEYFATAPLGGWHDCTDRGGRVLSDRVPASILYHVLGAFEAYATA